MTPSQPSTEAIWTHLSADLRRFIRRRVADDHVADDLLQETFVRVHRGVGTLREEDRLAAWVYRIARNVILDHHRRATGPAALGDADPADEPGDPLCTLRCRGAGWLDEMIRSLPDGYREAVQLAEIEGLSQQAVADRLGLSLSGAKSRVQRGRAMLKDVLDQCCRFEFDVRGNLTGLRAEAGPHGVPGLRRVATTVAAGSPVARGAIGGFANTGPCSVNHLLFRPLGSAPVQNNPRVRRKCQQEREDRPVPRRSVVRHREPLDVFGHRAGQRPVVPIRRNEPKPPRPRGRRPSARRGVAERGTASRRRPAVRTTRRRGRTAARRSGASRPAGRGSDSPSRSDRGPCGRL